MRIWRVRYSTLLDYGTGFKPWREFSGIILTAGDGIADVEDEIRGTMGIQDRLGNLLECEFLGETLNEVEPPGSRGNGYVDGRRADFEQDGECKGCHQARWRRRIDAPEILCSCIRAVEATC